MTTATTPTLKTIRTIYVGHNGAPNTIAEDAYQVDESFYLSAIRQKCPAFFRTPFGQRETYVVYRGFIICRHTVHFTGCRPERHTVVYLYDPVKNDMMHCGTTVAEDLKNIGHARKLIDRILSLGYKWFDMRWSDKNDPMPEVSK